MILVISLCFARFFRRKVSELSAADSLSGVANLAVIRLVTNQTEESRWRFWQSLALQVVVKLVKVLKSEAFSKVL